MSTATKTVSKTAPKTKSKPSGNYFYGVGRRKASSVRAKYYPTTMPIVITVDDKSFEEYFPLHFQKSITTFLNQVSIREGVIQLYARGGGVTGQTEASRLAIAKALVKFNDGLKPILKSFGYLSTDIRKVLSKKAGLRKARKAEQWSKR